MKSLLVFLLAILALLVASCCQYSHEGYYQGYLAGEPVNIRFSDVGCSSCSCASCDPCCGAGCPCFYDDGIWVYPAVPVYNYYPAPCVKTAPCGIPREKLLIYEPLPFQNPHLIRSPAP